MSNYDEIFYPACQKCDSILDIKINPENFTIDFECENDSSHNRSNIFFKTFERFYLKKKEALKCNKCSSSGNDAYFHCDDCKLLYCKKCLSEDIKINDHTNFEQFDENKCPIHKINFIEYCFDCRKNLCIYCIKIEKHENHQKDSFINIMLSSKNLKILKTKIEQKKKATINLINKIKDWESEIISKANELINSLKDEINLYEKIINSYSDTFFNYNYFKCFKYLYEYIREINNEYLFHFNETSNFQEQTKLMSKIFANLRKKHGNKTENIGKYSLKILLDKNFSLNTIERINESNFVFQYNKELYIGYYNHFEKRVNFRKEHKISLAEDIYTITNSINEKQLYVSLLNEKRIKIIDYDFEEPYLRINEPDIYVGNSRSKVKRFNKCIKLSNDYFITANNYITLWHKDEYNNSFSASKKIKFDINTFDILLIDDECFISTQPYNKTLTIFDNKNLNQLKLISNIDCVYSAYCLFKFKEKYIIINCIKGSGILAINTKELIQYIENDISLPDNKALSYDGDEYFYTFFWKDNSIDIIRLKITDDTVNVDKMIGKYNIDKTINRIIWFRKEFLLIGDVLGILGKSDDTMK